MDSNMSYETYKLGKTRQDKTKKRYTYEELEQLELPQLREICNQESIKTPTVDVLNQKEELVSLIYKHLGQNEERSINEWDEEAVGRIEKRIKIQKETDIKTVEVPAKIRLYKELDSFDEIDTKYEIITAAQTDLGYYCFLADEKNQIKAIITLIKETKKSLSSKKQNVYRLNLTRKRVAKKLKEGTYKNFSILLCSKDVKEDLVKAYYDLDKRQRFFEVIKVPIKEVVVEKAEETDEVLIIDYGTSFTTAGTYSFQDREIKKVYFTPLNRDMCNQTFCEEQKPDCKACTLCPSVIGVKKINGNRIEFIYGQEALWEEQKREYVTKNSIFYDTKRWVNQYKDEITVKDFDGNSCVLKGGDLVGAFLLYVIKKAEQQNKVKYKNICLTCPVKQQYLSLKMYQDVLEDYHILTEDVIDEAVAVLYHSLSNSIENMKYDSGDQKKVLIIDCGGGTSDLVQCSYRLTDQRITSQLDIQITYADGDTNFGGNNLTYRIVQYLKVKFAACFTEKKDVDWNIIMSGQTESFYDWVDAHGVEDCYETLNQAYEWAEEMIPTKFALYQTAPESVYLKVRGNFYFLWHMAEQIKKKFYHKSKVVSLFLEKEFYEDFHLYRKRKQGYLELHTICPKMFLVKEEIDLLLKPEIYGFMKHFVEPYYETGELYEIDQIYLSGQTLSIELFRDILKEYIAGRKARAKDSYSCDKKLMCLEGAIAYQGAKRIGQIKPMITYESPKIPYFLTTMDFQFPNGELVLIEEGITMKEVYSFVSRPIETKKLVFTLKDKNKKILHQVVIPIDTDGFQAITYEVLLEQYPMVRQEDLDNIIAGELKTFIYTDNRSWGYYVCHVARREMELCYEPPHFIPFEESQWKMNFFDGMH